jgi:hypothetical protein
MPCQSTQVAARLGQRARVVMACVLPSAAYGPRERYVCTSGARPSGRAADWYRASRGPLPQQSPCLGMLVRHCCAGVLPQMAYAACQRVAVRKPHLEPMLCKCLIYNVRVKQSCMTSFSMSAYWIVFATIVRYCFDVLCSLPCSFFGVSCGSFSSSRLPARQPVSTAWRRNALYCLRLLGTLEADGCFQRQLPFLFALATAMPFKNVIFPPSVVTIGQLRYM